MKSVLIRIKRLLVLPLAFTIGLGIITPEIKAMEQYQEYAQKDNVEDVLDNLFSLVKPYLKKFLKFFSKLGNEFGLGAKPKATRERTRQPYAYTFDKEGKPVVADEAAPQMPKPAQKKKAPEAQPEPVRPAQPVSQPQAQPKPEKKSAPAPQKQAQAEQPKPAPAAQPAQAPKPQPQAAPMPNPGKQEEAPRKSEHEVVCELVQELKTCVLQIDAHKNQFFSVQNNEKYGAHIARFKQGLASMTALKTKTNAAHGEYQSHNIAHLNTVVGKLREAQESWIKVVDRKYRSGFVGAGLLGNELKQLKAPTAAIYNIINNTLKTIHLQGPAQAQLVEVRTVITHIYTTAPSITEVIQALTARLNNQ